MDVQIIIVHKLGNAENTGKLVNLTRIRYLDILIFNPNKATGVGWGAADGLKYNITISTIS